ncbi:hypothetical protein GCK72_008687 [Caenorhabditis remanei]|uniref:Domain of unknown function WSN domain-containing protein n=1 Tax=Caenorhabditis remanei TaxID=31234 RepID=A0A6A5GY85_CAERE|nr:hypothetical protein GCK72_008687 [Caenorhabditis remanei]KAF1760438.1 hypothetical protein GCK72_008687 [Caenorhabditis remanei]
MNTRAKQKQGYKSVKEVFPKENSRHELKSVKSEQQTTNNAQTPKRKPLRGYPDNNFSSNLRNDGFYPPIEHPRFEDESDKYEDMGKTFTDLKPVSYNETVENYNENIEEEDPLNNSLPGHSNSLNSSFSVTRSLQETSNIPVPFSGNSLCLRTLRNLLNVWSAQSIHCHTRLKNRTHWKFWNTGKLDKSHRISSIECFFDQDLNKFYANYVFVGESVIYQLTNMLVQLFRKITHPSFNIWKYSFHPRSCKAVDWNFLPIPEPVLRSLQEFCFDICEAYLPDELLTGNIDSTISFMEKLPLIAPEQEVLRRRSIRQTVLKMTNNSIWQAMRTIRNYHFNKVTETLVSCSVRSDCATHLRWEHLKAFREKSRSQDMPVDSYTPEDVYQFNLQTVTSFETDIATAASAIAGSTALIATIRSKIDQIKSSETGKKLIEFKEFAKYSKPIGDSSEVLSRIQKVLERKKELLDFVEKGNVVEEAVEQLPVPSQQFEVRKDWAGFDELGSQILKQLGKIQKWIDGLVKSEELESYGSALEKLVGLGDVELAMDRKFIALDSLIAFLKLTSFTGQTDKVVKFKTMITPLESLNLHFSKFDSSLSTMSSTVAGLQTSGGTSAVKNTTIATGKTGGDTETDYTMLFVIVGVALAAIIIGGVCEAYFKCIRSRCGKGKQKTPQGNNKKPPKPDPIPPKPDVKKPVNRGQGANNQRPVAQNQVVAVQPAAGQPRDPADNGQRVRRARGQQQGADQAAANVQLAGQQAPVVDQQPVVNQQQQGNQQPVVNQQQQGGNARPQRPPLVEEYMEDQDEDDTMVGVAEIVN